MNAIAKRTTGGSRILIEAVTLRRAAPHDCEQVWSWNFAPDVRARSKRALAVAFAEHERWFMRRLVDGHDPMWVIEAHGLPVGVIRLDTSACGLTQVSIALTANARGRGIGRRAITAACQIWGKPVVAEIFADNLESRACFEACGFRSVVEAKGLLTYYWDPET
jgi:UDP-2,4-diacetamido-2,4,6-trideoxy-beta-L-altropyranose hydrolase